MIEASKQKGEISNLTIEVKKDLQKVILIEPIKLGYDEKKWTGKLVCKYLKDKWKIEIAIRTAQNWIMKISSRKIKRQRLN